MKKILTIGVVTTIFGVASANAGWLDKLGFGKSSEPKTLAEACDTNEITSVCPEMLLGSKTLVGCLSDNISSLSSKCAKYVKKYVTEHANELMNGATGGLTDATDAGESRVADVHDTVDAAKQDVNDTGNALRDAGNAIKNLF